MPKFKVIYDREACVGAGACTVVCEKFWKMNDDGKADLIGGDPNNEIIIGEEDLPCNKQAADSCPVDAIRIEEIQE